MSAEEEIGQLKERFALIRRLLNAIGDETRQSIISALTDAAPKGLRVGEITRHTFLSRPAVSHHMKILLDAEIVGVYSKGTMNFYYLKLGGDWLLLQDVINQVESFREMGMLDGENSSVSIG
jgi:ArsR family transcriptional regulator